MGAGNVIRCVLNENVNVGKVARELLRDLKLAGTGGEIAEITGGVRPQAACFGDNRLQQVQPATDQVNAGTGLG